MAFSLGEYQDIFLEEADEQLQELNQNLLYLEKNPDDLEVINNIFRAAHSLKSSAAFVGLNDLSDLAHKMENLLQGIRDRTMQVTPEIIEVIFNCFDVISAVIDQVGSGKKPDVDFSEIMERIIGVSSGKSATNAPPVAKTATDAAPARDDTKIQLTAAHMKQIRDALQNGSSCCEISVTLEPAAQMKWVKAQLIMANLERTGTVLASKPAADSLTDESVKDGMKIILVTANSLEEVRKACDIDQVQRVDLRKMSLMRKDDKMVLKFHERETLLEESMGKPEAAAGKRNAASADTAPLLQEDEDEDEGDVDIDIDKSETSAKKREDTKGVSLKIVKVSVDKLDQLLSNVGELVIANSGFYRLYEDLRASSINKTVTNEFKNRMDQMGRIAKDLQTGIMKTRMVPVGQVFSRFSRLVRDLAKEFGKNVRLEVRGEETELDKKVIDVLGEPLMHLIRNAIDHGIEPSEERRKINKPETATVQLVAFQSGNQILVQVADDGRGLNAPKIRKKALEKNLASPEALANMDDEDIHNFIFQPGFSTADVVSDISGRGVGMNVVKETVSELNGSVNIETEPGMGTRFILAFPLTLAIIPAIMVKVRRELFAIPLSDVIETIKISLADITTIEGHEVINLRGEILSLIRLNEFVGVDSVLEEGQKVPVVVVGYGNRKIGMVVDFLEGKQEIVIKSLEQNYSTVEGLAGASILGDGSICLILDIASMINKVILEQDRLSRIQRHRAQDVRKADIEVVKDVGDFTVKAAGVKQEAPRADKGALAKKEDTPQLKVETRENLRSAIDTKAPEPKHADPVPAREAVKEDIIFDKNRSDQFLPVEESGTARALDAAEVDARVKDVLQSFKDELKDAIKAQSTGGAMEDHISRQLGIDASDIERIRVLANMGITSAAESLSKIINKRVDLSIPEVSMMPVEKIPESVGEVDSTYIGVYMPLKGDIRGTILFSLQDGSGFELIDMLYGIGGTTELNEDGESALKEVTNIVGSSVINAFSEKTGIPIKPDVPTVVHDYMQSILDSILVMHNISNDYALVMDTQFYYQDDRVMGKLLIMPEAESLRKLVEKLR
ncbi:MAG: hypothetical protein EPN93_04320 [Spirochaetes bacterium]|nr:MAG: hypothetical protein EPN93_04320 [Spirochaetota bacterium]